MRQRRFGHALVACGAAALLASCGKPETARGPAAHGQAPRAVQVVAVKEQPMARSVFVTGTLAAQEQSTLSAKVPGRLDRLTVDIGSVVRQGDLVAQIERKDYELRLQQAAAALAQTRAALGLEVGGTNDQVELPEVASVKQASAVLDEAGKNRERVKNLNSSGIASQSELDTSEAAHRVALARHEAALEEARTRVAALAERRAQYDLARKQLEDTAITAPFDGAVQSRPASIGEYLTEGAPMVRLVKTDPLRLRLEVPERQSLLIRTGQVVRLLVEGDTNAYAGQIARLSPALEEQTRMLLVEADVPSRGALRAGLFARAEIVVNQNEPGLSVPPDALVVFAGLEKVVGVRDGQAIEKNVTTGRRGPGWVEIVSGVRAGELVVRNPAGLRTGQPVRVADTPQAQAASTAAVVDAKAR